MAPSQDQAVKQLFELLRDAGLHRPQAIVHRLVRGVHPHDAPMWLTNRRLDELQQAARIAPLHLPAALRVIRACQAHFAGIPQAACFDTAFHAELPALARRLPLADRFLKGIERCGFHGLSYEYVTGLLGDSGRTVIAHLGNGASMVAVRGGRSLDTTMGFTPTSGLMMGTRSGDVDPGLLIHLLRRDGLSADALEDMLNLQAGLLGVSGISGDMTTLLDVYHQQVGARDAIDLFCYTARRHLGALTAVLGGIDTLAFTGGIGEGAPRIRTLVCQGMDYLGIVLDERRNAGNEAVISRHAASCSVRVVHTDEDLMMARHAQALLAEQAAAAKIAAGDRHG